MNQTIQINKQNRKSKCIGQFDIQDKLKYVKPFFMQLLWNKNSYFAVCLRISLGEELSTAKNQTNKQTNKQKRITESQN